MFSMENFIIKQENILGSHKGPAFDSPKNKKPPGSITSQALGAAVYAARWPKSGKQKLTRRK
jgi:hypothetical protein